MKDCEICNTELGNGFIVREMMLGTRDEFEYAQCPECGTVHIIDIPNAIESYYPDYYYSFKEKVPDLKPLPFLKQIFKDFRMKKKYKRGGRELLKYFTPLKILPSQKILDIGCGKGKLICEMFNYGFTNVQGVDKYIDKEYNYGYGVKVFRKDLSELKSASYDLLMMHHVFEHMDKPFEELQKCYNLLKNNGCLIIRIPVIGKAWEDYRQNWVQLDAPRHFFIHTEKGMKILAEKSGFRITKTVYDSNSFQFWGSELYKRDIAFINRETNEYHGAKDFFSDEEVASYQLLAEELNKKRQGDQAIFYLCKQ